MNRDLPAEGHILGRGMSALATSARFLGQLARERARPEPVLVENRSFVEEALEELADFGNYVTWGVQSGQISDSDADAALVGAALAWRALTRTT